MATQLAPQKPRRQPPAGVQVLDDESTVELRVFARHYVSILLQLEGVGVTPATIADAQP
jgi:hypothetical protein